MVRIGICGLVMLVVTTSATLGQEPFAADYAKYLDFPDLKAFAVAVDETGGWAFGYGHSAPTIEKAKELALQHCAQGVARFALTSSCRIVALGDTRVAEIEWPDPSKGPQYEVRWVNGTSFVIGSGASLQVWVAFTLGSDPQALLFLANGGSESLTFTPEAIRATASKTNRKGTIRSAVQVFGPAEYERKVRNKQAWRATLYGAAVAMSNQPRPQTTSLYGNVTVQQSGRVPVHGSYSGVLTTWPSAADYAAANQQTAAQIEAMTGQLHASYDAMAASLLRTHTLLPGTYYGGVVHVAKFKGESITLEIPFGDTVFRATFTTGKK